MLVLVVVASGVSVYATATYLASEVEYNKNGQAKVADALDDLYAKTKDYKKLDTTTTANSNDIISGKTAYDNLENLIIGTYNQSITTKGTEWNEGVGDVTDGQISFNVGFDSPSEIWVRMSLSDKCVAYRFSKATGGYTKMAVTAIGTTGSITTAENQTPMNGSIFSLKVTASAWNGAKYRYIAIK